MYSDTVTLEYTYIDTNRQTIYILPWKKTLEWY